MAHMNHELYTYSDSTAIADPSHDSLYDHAFRQLTSFDEPEPPTIDPQLLFSNVGVDVNDAYPELALSAEATEATSTNGGECRPPLRRSGRLAARPARAGQYQEPADDVDGETPNRKPLSNTQGRKQSPRPAAMRSSKMTRSRTGAGRRVKENVLSRTPRPARRHWHCEVCEVDVVEESRTRSRHETTKHHRANLEARGMPVPVADELKCEICGKIFESKRTDSRTRHMKAKHA